MSRATGTNGILHAGFRGFRSLSAEAAAQAGFVARKKVRCTLIGNRSVIPPRHTVNGYTALNSYS